MSGQDICHKPRNIRELLPDISQLEEKARAQKHLDANESLYDLITSDLAEINRIGITQKQILDFHFLLRKLLLRRQTGNKMIHKKYTKCDEDKLWDFVEQHYSTYPTGGWSCQRTWLDYIKINEKRFLRYVRSFGGAEQCPIYTFYNPDVYTGFYYGYADHFFINLDTDETYWYPDLFPLQFFNYGFCQGKSCLYRTDPVKFINYFGLQPLCDYSDYSDYSKILEDKIKILEDETKILEDKTKILERDYFFSNFLSNTAASFKWYLRFLLGKLHLV